MDLASDGRFKGCSVPSYSGNRLSRTIFATFGFLPQTIMGMGAIVVENLAMEVCCGGGSYKSRGNLKITPYLVPCYGQYSEFTL